MGRKARSSPHFLEVDGQFLTKPREIANYFSSYFSNKIQNMRDGLQSNDKDDEFSSKLIRDKIMHNNCVSSLLKASMLRKY